MVQLTVVAILSLVGSVAIVSLLFAKPTPDQVDDQVGKGGAHCAAAWPGTHDHCPKAVAVCMAESSGNCKATGQDSGSKDRGLWQINSHWHSEVSDTCAYDCSCNGKEAHRISNKGTDWHPWSTYTSGAYKHHLAAGKKHCQNKKAGLQEHVVETDKEAAVTVSNSSGLLGGATHATAAQVEKAIGWQDKYYKKHGTSTPAYQHRCITFVHDAYAHAGHPREDILGAGSAADAGRAASKHKRWNPWNAAMHESLVPRGAAVFWSECGGSAGHAVLATGNKMANSDTVGNKKIHWLINTFCYGNKPMGWIRP